MSLDEWRIRSPTIPIRTPKKKEHVVIGTPLTEYKILVESVSQDLVIGILINTPPKAKHFRKGDNIMFHVDNILTPHHHRNQVQMRIP